MLCFNNGILPLKKLGLLLETNQTSIQPFQSLMDCHPKSRQDKLPFSPVKYADSILGPSLGSPQNDPVSQPYLDKQSP